MLLTHMERTVSELDGVMRTVQDRLDTLEHRVTKLGENLRDLAEEA